MTLVSKRIQKLVFSRQGNSEIMLKSKMWYYNNIFYSLYMNF